MEETDTIYFADGLGDIDSDANIQPLDFPESAHKDLRKNI